MSDHFQPLLRRSLEALGPDSGEIILPEEYRERRRVRGGSELWLQARAYRPWGEGEHRVVTLSSPKVDILIWFHYPDASRRLPVYAMEFVRLGGRPVVAVLDLPELHRQPGLAAPVMAACRQGINVPGSADMPEWYRECRSGHDLFARPDSDDELGELGTVHLRLLAALRQLDQEAGTLDPDSTGHHAEAMMAYRQHHHRNSPGLPLMNSCFGEDWTAAFMGDWLFR